MTVLRYSTILLVLFLGTAAYGMASALLYPELTQRVIDQLVAQFSFVRDLSPAMLGLVIFANNVGKALVGMLLGVLFGVVPVLIVMGNAFLLGIVIGSQADAIGVPTVLLALAPHGIIEIAALLVAMSYGMWLGGRFYGWLSGTHRGELKASIGSALRRFALVVAPLLFIAALIEAFVTPAIMTLLNINPSL